MVLTLHRFSFVAGLLTVLALFALLLKPVSWKGAMYHSASSERYMHGRGIAEKLGMTREELREELSQGKSMMEIARERGVELMFSSRWIHEEKRALFLQNMADRIGIPVEELRQELSSGKSLLDIAEERGVRLTFPFPKDRRDRRE